MRLEKENLKVDNKSTIEIFKCVEIKKLDSKFWQKEKDFGTDILDSGYQFGNGYAALADDFPEGAILKVTSEIILPDD